MGGTTRRQGHPINCQIKFLQGCFDVIRLGLNVTTIKKVSNFWREEKCTPEKILATPMSGRKGRECEERGEKENGPRLTLVWGPRMVNPALPMITDDDTHTVVAEA